MKKIYFFRQPEILKNYGVTVIILFFHILRVLRAFVRNLEIARNKKLFQAA